MIESPDKGGKAFSMAAQVKFSIGQLVHHRLFDYRGVIVDVDPFFLGSEEWYEHVAKSKPPKDQPWYHVLVHGGNGRTYVAQRNLEEGLLSGTHQPSRAVIVLQRFSQRSLPNQLLGQLASSFFASQLLDLLG